MSELYENYGGWIETASHDATTEENAAINKDLGFQTHGLVIKDAKGSVLFKQADHNVKMEDVEAFLDRYIQEKTEGSD